MKKLLAVSLVVAAGCTPDLPRDEPGAYVVALFDPAAATPVVPLPTNLAIGENGLLDIDDRPGATDAERQFNRYLRTLDGFPTEATATAPFSAALDPATVKPENIRIFDTTNPESVTALTPTEITFDAAKKELSVKASWQRARQYAIALIGGDAGLRGANGEPVIGSPGVLLLRSKQSLFHCPPDSAGELTELPCADVRTPLVDADSAAILEPYRRQLQPALLSLEASGVSRDDVAAIWGFNTVTQPLATFDPKNKIVPFPNDLLMANGKVNLPADPNDDAQTASTKLLLNELDGFSTTASILTEFGRETGATNARIDPASLAPEQFLLVNLSDPAEMVPVSVTCRGCSATGTEPDQLALTPSRPLRSHTQYGVFWLKGARDQAGTGRLANTGSIFALMRLSTPLWKDNASTLSTVDVLTAALLEPLRVQTQTLLAITDARGIAREDVLLAWSFTTQTTSDSILELAAKPGQWNLPTAISNVTTLDIAQLAFVSNFTMTDWHSQIRIVHEGRFTSGNALTAGQELDPLTGQMIDGDIQFTPSSLTTPRQEQLRFFLSLPVTAKHADGRIPVLIFQHGLTGHRRNAILFANTAAKRGYAVLAIDAPFHGERSYCRQNSECATGTQCVNHRCPGGYAFNQGDPTQTPVISGLAFASATNPFATRDRFRHQIIDFAQLIRVLKNTTNGIGAMNVDNTSTTVVERLDTADVRYVGQSLGGILGTLATVAIPDIKASTLNVPGADPVAITLTSEGFASQKQQLDTYLASRGISRGSQRYEEFMDTARWVLDPADPQNYGRHLIAEPLTGGAKRVFVSWVEADAVVPNPTTETLLRSITTGSLPQLFKQTKYVMDPVQNAHVFMLDVGRRSVAADAQMDAMDWVDQ